MVAEAIPQTEVTPPNDDALLTPDPTPESTPAPEVNEEDAALDAILEGLGSDDVGTGDEDGKSAAPDGLVPPAEKALTPEEAKEQGRREAEAEIANKQKALQDQAYIEGVRRSFQSVDADINAKAKERGWDLDDVEWIKSRFQSHNGHWNVLHKAALDQASPQIKGQAYQEAEAEVSKLLLTTISEELGESALKAIQTAAPKTWPDLAKAITKEARKGYVAKEEVVKGQKALLKKLEGPLSERGITLAQITGSTGPQTPAARGGTGSQPKDYAEAEAWHASGKWDNAQMRAYKATHSRN